MATVLTPAASVPLPMAVAWSPLAIEAYPVAIEACPLALLPYPKAVANWLLANTLAPRAKEEKPLACASTPAANENIPILSGAHVLPVRVVPALNAERLGIHIRRVPASLTGATGGLVSLVARKSTSVWFFDQKPPVLVFCISFPPRPDNC